MIIDELKAFYLLFEGEGDPDPDPDPDPNPNPDPDPDPDPGKTFTQSELNKILATDRRKNEEKTKKLIGELETLKKSKNLTEQQQKQLSERIEELQDQLLTKEQLAQKDKEKLKTDYEKELETVTGERDRWRSRFEKALIINAIHKAAEEHEAVDTTQMIALIQANGPRVVQELDENGEPKDSFTPRVKMVDYDSKENKEVTLDLTISEAVKRMKERKENFNLFKSTVNGGLGLDSGTGRSGPDTPPLTDPAAYRKWRKQHLKTS